jgi:hypothetical protein
MSSAGYQMRLSERGIENFKDLTPERWQSLYRDAISGKIPVEDLLWVITLALFYRSEVEHPEWYTQKKEAVDQSQP